MLTNNSYCELFESNRICSGIVFTKADSFSISYKEADAYTPSYHAVEIEPVVWCKTNLPFEIYLGHGCIR